MSNGGLFHDNYLGPRQGIFGALGQIGKDATTDANPHAHQSYGSNTQPRKPGASTLDDFANAIRPGSTLKRTADNAGLLNAMYGGMAPVPDVQNAPFKRAHMPGNADIPVSVYRHKPMKAGPGVNVTVFLDSRAYGDAARDLGAMKRQLPDGMSLWIYKKHEKHGLTGTERVEARTVTMLNRSLIDRARKVGQLMSFWQFSFMWSPFGVVKYVATGQMDDASPAQNCVLSVSIDSKIDVPGLWLHWHENLKPNYTLWWVYVARTLGYEEQERELTWKDNRSEEFIALFDEAERNRERNAPARIAQLVEYANAKNEMVRKEMDLTGDNVTAVAGQLSGAASALSNQPDSIQSGYDRLMGANQAPVRYARWEPYVTTDSRPPPKYVYNTVDPRTGERHKGGYRVVGMIMNDIPAFQERQRWKLEIQTALYADPHAPFQTASWASCIAHIPKITVQTFSHCV